MLTARDLVTRLKREPAELCIIADYDVVTIRDRSDRGKGLELRLCRYTMGSGIRCRYYYLSRRRIDQLERLLGKPPPQRLHEALATLRDLCRLLYHPPRTPPTSSEGSHPSSRRRDSRRSRWRSPLRPSSGPRG